MLTIQVEKNVINKLVLDIFLPMQMLIKNSANYKPKATMEISLTKAKRAVVTFCLHLHIHCNPASSDCQRSGMLL